jgi:hypothetical protein
MVSAILRSRTGMWLIEVSREVERGYRFRLHRLLWQ